MKNLNSVLHIAALLLVIFVCTSSDAIAQQDGPPRPPCNRLDMDGRTIPWPCKILSQDDRLVLQPYKAAARNDGSVSQLYNAFVKATPSTEPEVKYLVALLQGRRQEFALIRG